MEITACERSQQVLTEKGCVSRAHEQFAGLPILSVVEGNPVAHLQL